VLIGAGLCVVLIAVAAAGIVVTSSPGPGPGAGLSGLVVSYPSAFLAGGQAAGPGGSPGAGVPPVLTGIAAAGNTVVAVGAQATLPSARPLVLTSPNCGRTWRRAVLHAAGGGGATGPGAVPLMVAGGHGRWLAVAPDATWTSPDGRSWQLGPGIAPLAGGDRVRALARTRRGFVAVGENLRLRGKKVVRTPVLGLSTNGQTWRRRGASQLRLPAPGTRVLTLRWAAARGGALMIAGGVTRTVVVHRKKRTVRLATEVPEVWLSRDGGARWLRADPPVSGGASHMLAGLAATASGIVAVRPGRSLSGTADALAYVWTPGSGWSFGAPLTGRRGAALHVTSVAGSDHGVVVAGSAGRYRVAFVSPDGSSWHETADLGRSSAGNVTGVTAGPGGEVVAGWTHPQSFLLLAHGRRAVAGRAALAGVAAAGMGVNGLGAGPGGQVAVGHADGAPAIWLRPAGAHWTRMAAATPPAWHGTGPGLTGVVRGGAGWLAVGGEGSPAGSAAQVGSAGTLDSAIAPGGQQPILLTSPDGRAWSRPAAAGSLMTPGRTLTGAAAGPSGYVVTGVRDDDGQPRAGLWWSANLTTWKPQGWWTGSPPSGAASALLAVAAGQTGFAAVGAVGTQPAVWLSRSGQEWQLRLLPVPAGAGSAVLQRVAIQGRRITALGTQAGPSGPVPFAAVSADGGRAWREAALPAGGSPAGVTALVAADGGFLAAATRGAGTQDVVIWWSRNGLAWHAVRAPGARPGAPGGQQITGLSVSGNALTGVGYAATPAGRHPVLWRIRTR
jgi:hypothetical protein